MLGVFLQGGLGWCWWQGWGPREVLAAAGLVPSLRLSRAELLEKR